MRLSNCGISSVAGLARLMSTLTRHTITTGLTNLTWLDLSFNSIKTLNTEPSGITSLKGIRLGNKINVGTQLIMLSRIIYLHCNLLEDWNILDVLKRLKKLTRLTLHCNPLAAKKCYRPTIIGNLPFLKSLDFSLISEEERDAVRLGITAKFIR